MPSDRFPRHLRRPLIQRSSVTLHSTVEECSLALQAVYFGCVATAATCSRNLQRRRSTCSQSFPAGTSFQRRRNPNSFRSSRILRRFRSCLLFNKPCSAPTTPQDKHKGKLKLCKQPPLPDIFLVAFQNLSCPSTARAHHTLPDLQHLCLHFPA